MTDDNDAGAAYLASLRQSATHQGAAAAPARAGDLPDAAEQRNGGTPSAWAMNNTSVDHRKSPRYKCAGSARIQEAGSAIAMWVTFADISMHGCYIETAAPLRVGAVLNLKLDANGFRIETTGEVRVIYSGLGMGVSFSQMSREDRDRLRELVRSIAPPSVILGSRTANSPLTPALRSEVSPAVANPEAALQAILKFFENRHVMGREEFLRILRTSQ